MVFYHSNRKVTKTSSMPGCNILILCLLWAHPHFWLLHTRYSTNDQIALKNLQSDVTERKLDIAKKQKYFLEARSSSKKHKELFLFSQWDRSPLNTSLLMGTVHQAVQPSILSESHERRQPYFMTPRVPLPGFYCPLYIVCASLQEDGAVQLETQFPKDYTCCDLVVKLKELEKHEDPTVTPEPSPATPSPSSPEVSTESGPSEDSSEPLLTNSMTLQEALQVQRPQFISRSQERLQKLKHMVQ